MVYYAVYSSRVVWCTTGRGYINACVLEARELICIAELWVIVNSIYVQGLYKKIMSKNAAVYIPLYYISEQEFVMRL